VSIMDSPSSLRALLMVSLVRSSTTFRSQTPEC
jgi:hypothetical protein